MHSITIWLLSLTLLLVSIGQSERRIRYIATERPHAFFNPKYLTFVNITSRRFSRQNQIYKVDLHFSTPYYFGNNVTFHFSFYKDLVNGHQRLMFEIKLGFCDLVTKNAFFGPALRQGKLLGKCPFKPGDYHLYNMSIPFDAIPQNFPHFRGKIVLNVTREDTKEFMASGWIEMDVKTLVIKSDKNNKIY